MILVSRLDRHECSKGSLSLQASSEVVNQQLHPEAGGVPPVRVFELASELPLSS